MTPAASVAIAGTNVASGAWNSQSDTIPAPALPGRTTLVDASGRTIAQAFTSQIITPIFTAIASGVPISQAISQQAIANVRELAEMEAQSRSKAWKVVQDRFQENLANLQKLLQPK